MAIPRAPGRRIVRRDLRAVLGIQRFSAAAGSLERQPIPVSELVEVWVGAGKMVRDRTSGPRHFGGIYQLSLRTNGSVRNTGSSMTVVMVRYSPCRVQCSVRVAWSLRGRPLRRR
jgi:hypothetical protein